MANSNKKGGVDLDKAPSESTADVAKQADNLFSRHGNQQITEVIAAAQATDQAPDTVLASAMANESDVAADQGWWAEEEQTASRSDKEDEEAQLLLAANQEENDAQRQASKQQADKDAQRGRRLQPQEELALLQSKKGQMSRGELAEQEINILKDAERAGMDSEQQAQMLLAQGDVSKEVVDQTTGAVRAHLAADQMPDMLAGFARDAAGETSDTPLNERDTIRNVTEELRLIAAQMQNHPSLMDPEKSIEDKATALVDVLAFELDVPTRESVAAHPFVGLHDDLVFNPQAIMAINQIAGSSREVRALGSFAVVAWQLAVDTVHDRLNTMEDDESIQEDQIWRQCMNELADQMYTDALLKPSAS
jgi:hypothetical protein